MTTVQREARTFLSQFHHHPFTVSDLEQALQAQGFSLVEYSRVSNCREVTTLLTSLRLFDYASSQAAFTYQDPNLRIVFLLENLSQQEQMILLTHELGHILCGHMEQTVITGPGTSVLQEQEANDFANRLLRYNRNCRRWRIGLWAGAALVALALAGALLFGLSGGRTEQMVYLTQYGECYHRKDCQFVAGKENVTAVTVEQAESGGYTACTWCFGRQQN